MTHHKSTEYIHVTFEPDNSSYLDRIPGNATYKEIQTWVRENYGLTVSTLYIAQIKEKLGIKEHECYNKPRTENPKVPTCPPEKEVAIEVALRHFRMI